MKSLCFILLLALVLGASARFSEKFHVPSSINSKENPAEAEFVFENDDIASSEEDIADISTRGLILNKEVKKALKNIKATLPCGWPEYGIPPLAPYTNKELTINIKKSFIETITKLIRFRVDGLEYMYFNELKVSYTFKKKVKYSVTIPKIILTAKIDTDILINLMEEYGINIRYNGSGDSEIILEDIMIKGSFKYKMPFIFGSIKIYNFNCEVSLGKITSDIGLLGNGKFNRLLNDKIEEWVWKAINYNQNSISTKIEETLVPRINDGLTGHKIWYVIGKLGGSSKVCVPPPNPWAMSDNNVL